MRWLVVGIFFVGFGLACGVDEGGAGDGSDAPVWTVVPEVRIGSLDDEEQSLTRVTQVLFGTSGSILIAQPQDRTIRVFDSAGQSLRTIGREGEGPGEFRSVTRAGLAGDTLWVADYSLGRITFFQPDGQPIRTMPWSVGWITAEWGTYSPFTPSVLLADRTGISTVSRIMMASAPQSSQPIPRIPFLRTDSAGTVVNTLAWQDLESGERTTAHVRGREFNLSWTDPDSPLFEIAADGSGLVVVERRRAPDTTPSAFSVRLIGPAGDTVFSLTVPHTPIPTPAWTIREVAEQLAERLDRGAGLLTPDLVESELRSAGLVPRTLTPVTRITTGADGTIWLELAAASAETTTWLVIDNAAKPIGRLDLPSGQRVMAAAEDRLAVLELDELDVPYVVVYRVHR